MSHNYLSNKFSGEYLERYRRGELSARESHELESASLEDPLLAEALDGFYSASRSSEHELNYLKQWVNERVEESQASIRFIPKRRSFAPMLRVAAVFLVVVSASWMGYIFWMDRTQPLLADAGTGKPVANRAAPVDESGSASPVQTDLSPMPPNVPSEERVVVPVEKLKEEPKRDVDNPSVSDQGQVVAPVQRAEADVVSPPPIQADVKNLEDKASRDLAEAKQVETVSVTNSSKRLSAEQAKSFDLPVPAVGWTSYESYLDRNRVAAPTASNTITSSLVVLTFEVDKEGRPTDIQVERSAGTFYDEKAMELLKKGPGWIPGKSGKRAELQVRF